MTPPGGPLLSWGERRASTAVVERSADAGLLRGAANLDVRSGRAPALGARSGPAVDARSRHAVRSLGGLPGPLPQPAGPGADPGMVTCVAITGPCAGHAPTGQGRTARFWSVSQAGGRFTPIPLPAGLARLGSPRPSAASAARGGGA
jgi:hypothetical protein